jgi:PEP-CTERM motif
MERRHSLFGVLLTGCLCLLPAAALATPFTASLTFSFRGFGSVSFTGSGSGTSAPGVVSLPASAGLSGSGSVALSGSRVSTAVVRLAGHSTGVFTGTPLAGPMGLMGTLVLKGDLGGGPTTLVNFPLRDPHTFVGWGGGLGVPGFAATSGAFGTFWGADGNPWSRGAQTLNGVSTLYYIYHLPVGPKASSPIATTFVNGTAMYTGSDSRTPGGLGQVTLVSPILVHGYPVAGHIWQTVLVGSLTLNFVPEPGTFALLGTGVVALSALAGRRRRARAARRR